MGRILKYNEAKLKLIKLIKDTKLKKGERLPAARILVEKFGISLISVHRAMEELETLGFIKKTAGVGSFYEGGLNSDQYDPTLAVVNIGDHLFPNGRSAHELSTSLKAHNTTYKIIHTPHEVDSSILERLQKYERFIVTGFVNENWIDCLKSLNKPMIQVGACACETSTAKVLYDWNKAFELALKILKEGGCKNIAFFLPPPSRVANPTILHDLFIKTMQQLELPVNTDLIKYIETDKPTTEIYDVLHYNINSIDAAIVTKPNTLYPYVISSTALNLQNSLPTVVMQGHNDLPPDVEQWYDKLYNVYFPESILAKAIELLYIAPYSFFENKETCYLQPVVKNKFKIIIAEKD